MCVHRAIRRARHGLAASSRPRVLFIAGSLNQTTQLHAVARELPECEARFTPYYGDLTVTALRHLGLLEATIGGNKRRRWCLDYLRDHQLLVDLDGHEGRYDLVVTCTDLQVPRNVRSTRLLVVQEGILDPMGLVAQVCRRLRWLPRWLAGTALTGQSGLFDRFCVASQGYKDFFVEHGIEARKIAVTGIPNFDDCRRFTINRFPHQGYVLVCTSDARETLKRDDRAGFVRSALEIAKGRRIIFKLHPNEGPARAEEIRALAPGALVYSSGSAEEMIANAEVVVTQWSSTAFVALALGKEVHSHFPIEQLRQLLPIQNGGRSAGNIARVCREVLASNRPSPIMAQNPLRLVPIDATA
jgi:hypothetical protein